MRNCIAMDFSVVFQRLSGAVTNKSPDQGINIKRTAGKRHTCNLKINATDF